MDLPRQGHEREGHEPEQERVDDADVGVHGQRSDQPKAHHREGQTEAVDGGTKHPAHSASTLRPFQRGVKAY